MAIYGDGTRIMFAHVMKVSGVYEWIEVHACNLDDARQAALLTSDVVRVLEVSFIPGGVLT